MVPRTRDEAMDAYLREKGDLQRADDARHGGDAGVH